MDYCRARCCKRECANASEAELVLRSAARDGCFWTGECDSTGIDGAEVQAAIKDDRTNMKSVAMDGHFWTGACDSTGIDGAEVRAAIKDDRTNYGAVEGLKKWP